MLISRVFREGVRRSVSEVFRIQVISKLSDVKSPVLTLGSTTFLYIREGSLWVVAVTRDNADASKVLQFLYSFVDLLEKLILSDGSDTSAISNKSLTEIDITDNFIAIYEILDRILDYGYVQDWDLQTIKSTLNAHITHGKGIQIRSPTKRKSGDDRRSSNGLIRSGSRLLSRANVLRHRSSSQASLQGISGKRKGRITLNVNEKVSMLVSHSGTVVRAFVEGSIDVASKFTGHPECSFRLVRQKMPIMGRYRGADDEYMVASDGEDDNDDDDDDDADDVDNRDILEGSTSSGKHLRDCNFHGCVNLQQFEIDGVVRFVPPEEDFIVMKYRADISSAPFIVYFHPSGSKFDSLEFTIELWSHYPKEQMASDVVLKIPTPPDTIGANVDADTGKSRLLSQDECIEWHIKKLAGQRVSKLSAALDLSKDSDDKTGQAGSWSNRRAPISLDFTMEGFSTSGYRIAYLKVEEGKLRYPVVKSVSYCSKANSYEVRL